MKYETHKVDADGWTDWIQPVRKGYKMRCCDCGLVHVLDFRVSKGRVQFRARRDQRATGQIRRRRKTYMKGNP